MVCHHATPDCAEPEISLTLSTLWGYKKLKKIAFDKGHTGFGARFFIGEVASLHSNSIR